MVATKTNVVFFPRGGKPLLGNNEKPSSGRLDASTLLFGVGSHEQVLLSIAVNESSRTNRKTRSMAHDVSSALEQNARLVMFHRNQQFRFAVRETPRLAPDVVSQSVSPVQSSPVQSSPVQSSPVQSSPVQSSPVQSSPVQSSPVQSSPVQSSPVQSVSVGFVVHLDFATKFVLGIETGIIQQ